MKAYEITFHFSKVMKLASSVLIHRHKVKSVTDSQFVSHDLFIYYLNQMGVTSKMSVRKS